MGLMEGVSCLLRCCKYEMIEYDEFIGVCQNLNRLG